MGHWNLRMSRQRFEDEIESGYLYALREIHYDDDGNVRGWSEDPIAPTAESLPEMYEVLDYVQRVTEESIFDVDERRFLTEEEATKALAEGMKL